MNHFILPFASIPNHLSAVHPKNHCPLCSSITYSKCLRKINYKDRAISAEPSEGYHSYLPKLWSVYSSPLFLAKNIAHTAFQPMILDKWVQMSVHSASAPLMHYVLIYALDSRVCIFSLSWAPGLDICPEDFAMIEICPLFDNRLWVWRFAQMTSFTTHQWPAS